MPASSMMPVTSSTNCSVAGTSCGRSAVYSVTARSTRRMDMAPTVPRRDTGAVGAPPPQGDGTGPVHRPSPWHPRRAAAGARLAAAVVSAAVALAGCSTSTAPVGNVPRVLGGDGVTPHEYRAGLSAFPHLPEDVS